MDAALSDFVIEDDALLASLCHLVDTDMWIVELSNILKDSTSIPIGAKTNRLIEGVGASEGLSLLYLFAESFGLKEIRLSVDGPIYKGIPIYE